MTRRISGSTSLHGVNPKLVKLLRKLAVETNEKQGITISNDGGVSLELINSSHYDNINLWPADDAEGEE